MDRKNRNRAFAAALVCVLAAGMVTGCANPRKAGAQAMEEGQYEEAVTQFQQAAESENRETAAEGCRGLGMAYYELEDYESALEAFRQAEDNGAQMTVQTYNLMGVCAMQTGDYASALEYIQAGLAMADSATGDEVPHPDLMREMRYNEIICYEQQADWENAKTKAAEYLSEYPDDEAVQKEAQFLETR